MVGSLRSMVVVCLGAATLAASAEDRARPALGAALETLFSPRAAPAAKTMGLVQRTFVDLVEQSEPRLEVAIVIDGTESMGDQLAAAGETLGRMMNDLELYRSNQIAYQLVVFRDEGADGGAVEFPLGDGRFVAVRAAVLAAVEAIRPQSGAPYFPELIDQGVSDAITRLDWSAGDDVTRWLLVIGDAPPFDASFSEPDNRAGRRVATDRLVALAAAKSIQINCVLCNSREADREASQRLVGRARDFMNTLSSKTGGLMLDLSYADIRRAIREAAPTRTVAYQRIEPIRREDLRRERQRVEELKNALATSGRVRLAVLPHLPVERMTFEPRDAAVRLATELRMRLADLPGVELADPRRVERRFRVLAAQGLSGEGLVQLLGKGLGVDYLLWGSLSEAGGVLEARSALYERVAGRAVLRVRQATGAGTPADRLATRVTEQLLASSARDNAVPRLAASFASLQRANRPERSVFRTISTADAHEPLMAGLGALEQALGYTVTDADGARLIGVAADELAEASGFDPGNPMVEFLLASCHFNRSQRLTELGDEAGAKQAARDARTALRKARRFADRTDDETLKDEIAADYALIVQRDAAAAATLYKKLADAPGTPLDVAGRSTWMLSGIYAGDWGADDKVADAAKARQRLVQLLSHWPDSPQAEFVRRQMRWDDTAGKTRVPAVPLEHGELVEEDDVIDPTT